jgi:hypothetical protein
LGKNVKLETVSVDDFCDVTRIDHLTFVFATPMNYPNAKTLCSNLGGQMYSPPTMSDFEKFLSANRVPLKSDLCESGQYIWMPFVLDKERSTWCQCYKTFYSLLMEG